jgi:hypothetical protein
VNDAPVAGDDSYSTHQNAALVVPAPGVLGSTPGAPGYDNDDDSARTSLKAVLFRGPAHGTVSLGADGSFTYTPNPGFAGVDTFTYKANDGLWTDGVTPMSPDSNVATVTIAVVDNTPPLVTIMIPPPTGSNGYFKTKPVSVSVSATDASNVAAISCTDNGAQIAVGGLSGIGTATASGTIGITAEGANNVRCTATDGAGNGGAAPGSTNYDSTGTGAARGLSPVLVDTVPPVASIASGPAQGAELAFGLGLGPSASASFSFSATDPQPASGVALVTCLFDGAALPAATCASGSVTVTNLLIGTHTFSVRATDNAGNVGAYTTRTFKVVWAFSLTALKSPANLGSAVPVSFGLQDPQGNTVSTLTAGVPMILMQSVFNGPAPASGVCSASATPVNPEGPETLYSPATGATGGSSFRFVSPGYQFNWDSTTAKTTPIKTGAGCYTILITLSDGSAVKMTNGVNLTGK